MKKLIVLALVVFVVWGMFFYRDEEVLYDSVGRGEVSYYTRYAAGDVPKASVTQNGQGSIVTCAFADYRKVRSMLKEISGVSIRFEGDYEDIEKLIEKLEIKSVAAEKLDEYGIVSYYGFTFKLKSRIYADGKFINVQIAKNGGIVTVGYPVILGSY